MGLLNNGLKIQESMDKSVKLFVITYPSKGGKPLAKSMELLKSIVGGSDIIVNIDTSLCFLDKSNTSKSVEELKRALTDKGIPFEYRAINNPSSGMGVLGRILGFSRSREDREIITYNLPRQFSDNDLFNIMLKIGAEIFVPFELSDNIAQEIFNCHFQDTEKRFTTFKYVAYINSYVGQAAIRTKALTMEDVQQMASFE